jgi:hypothetical protein
VSHALPGAGVALVASLALAATGCTRGDGDAGARAAADALTAVRAGCDELASALEVRLGTGAARGRGDRVRFFSDRDPTPGCEFSLAGRGSATSLALDSVTRATFVARGWRDRDDYAADGHGTTVTGHEREAVLCVRTLEWPDGDDAHDPDDTTHAPPPTWEWRVDVACVPNRPRRA